MKIIRADAMGMCFGVRDALNIVDEIANPQSVAIHGELVHNETVQERLRRRGFQTTQFAVNRRQGPTRSVVVTAHGISDRERDRLHSDGLELIDTTCPLVARVHATAQRFHDEGCFVLVIGRAGHTEVRGIVGDLERHAVIGRVEDIRRFEATRLGIVCQTTMPSREVEIIRRAIESKNPHADIHFADTVCQPTKDRQAALDRLLAHVDAVVIVGGKHSNNTSQLTETCRLRGIPALQVQCATDLDARWFAGYETVGLTAGTSTLESSIDEIHAALVRLSAKADEGSRRGAVLQSAASNMR